MIVVSPYDQAATSLLHGNTQPRGSNSIDNVAGHNYDHMFYSVWAIEGGSATNGVQITQRQGSSLKELSQYSVNYYSLKCE